MEERFSFSKHKMKFYVLLVFLIGVVFAEVLVPVDYHRDVGIPLAAKIKEAEERIGRNAEKSQDRIIGGVISHSGSHPYLGGLLVSFWNQAGVSVCGSSLLSANRAVTAAHCWRYNTWQGRELTLVLGSNFLFSGGLRVSTSTVIMHPEYNMSVLRNDIAMIYLPYSVQFSASIQPIALPSVFELGETFVGEWALAAGFGTTSDNIPSASNNMNEVYLQVITNDMCRDTYLPAFVTEGTLCTSGIGFVGVCSGDSGGPLVVARNGQRILIGVSSFAANGACSHGHPSGFARVTNFHGFITSHL